MQLFLTPLAQFSACIAATLCIAAAIWGRWPERLGAVTNALNCLGSALLEDRHPGHHGQPGILAVDALMLAIFLIIALRCRRIWILWAAACAVLSTFTDICIQLDMRIEPWSYFTASYVWGLGGVAALAAGVAFEGRRPLTAPRFEASPAHP